MVTQGQSAEVLFEQALVLKGGERAAFLDGACSESAELRERVEELLARDAAAGSFLKHPLFGFRVSEDSAGDATTRTDDCLFDDGLHPVRAQSDQFSAGDILSGRFRVVRFIANGGMGEVYEVEDGELQGVRLALKTILPQVAEKADMQARFEREVLLARRVVHSNLCPIYDIFHCRHNGAAVTFLTMKLLSGETLAAHIKARGPLTLAEATPIVLQVADALTAAHEAGILHRDIKAANVMLGDASGRVHACVMDFGLARAYRSESTVLTADGVAGTPGYVAPELFHGGEPSTASDVYAFGVMVYHMLTGHLPPVRLSPKSRPAREPLIDRLLGSWKAMIDGCLQPDVADRYQTISQAVAAIRPGSRSSHRLSLMATHMSRRKMAGLAVLGVLGLSIVLASLFFIPAVGERVRGILFASGEKHIAVLPLDAIADDPESQALGDGLMDSLAGSLSNLKVHDHSLWVIPASDVRSRKVKDPASALREFGATIVVKGSFEHHGPSARLKLILIDPKKNTQIGFVDVENQTGDLAALQDEAVTRLVRLMNISVEGTWERDGEAPPSHAAYEDYLAGLGYFQRKDKPGNLDRAINALANAVKTDPHFALGFARLAQVYTMKYQLSSDPQWLQRAEEYSRQAAEMDSQVPLTYAVLAHIHTLTGNHELAIQEFQRSLSLDPRDTDALNGIAHSYEDEGRFGDAEAAYIKAAALRPDDWTGYNALGIFYENNGHPNEAITQFKRALDLTPDNSWCYTNLALAYQNLDDPRMLGKAEDAFKKSISISPTFGAYGDLGFLYEQLHRFPESIAASQEALRLNDQSPDIWANLTSAYEWLKNDREANAVREKAISLFERDIKLNPQNSDARATLAVLYAKNGQRAKAIDAVHISLALASKSAYVLSQAADSYELLGNRKESIKYLTLALAHGLSKGQLSADPEIQEVLSDPAFQMRSN